MRVLAVADRDHPTELAVGQQVDGHVGERDRHHLVERVRVAGAQVVGQVGVDGLDARPAVQLIGESLADIGLVAVPVGVRLADLAELAAAARSRPRWR